MNFRTLATACFVIGFASIGHAQWLTNPNGTTTPIYYNDGSVGIGTANPSIGIPPLTAAKFITISASVYAGIETQRTPAVSSGDIGFFDFYNGATRVGEFEVAADGAPNSGKFIIWTADAGALAARMIVTGNGRVGIGIGNAAPSAMLQVGGDVAVSGNIAAKYQDVAEWVDAPAMEAGTVVTLNPERSNQVVPSIHAYDTSVAGVVSARPGVILGESGPGKEMVATTGRVRVRVDAKKTPIRIGDLLVTSDVPGVAMRSEPVSLNGVNFHRPGTILGKALEPLASGQGEILVLLTLQ
jgi:hypothetical protein